MTPTCRDCMKELVSPDNWYPSMARRNNRACKTCVKAGNLRWNHENVVARKQQKHRYDLRQRLRDPDKIRKRIRKLQADIHYLEGLLREQDRTAM